MGQYRTSPDDVWYAGVKESDLAVERLLSNPGVEGPNKTPDAH